MCFFFFLPFSRQKKFDLSPRHCATAVALFPFWPFPLPVSLRFFSLRSSSPSGTPFCYPYFSHIYIYINVPLIDTPTSGFSFIFLGSSSTFTHSNINTVENHSTFRLFIPVFRLSQTCSCFTPVFYSFSSFFIVYCAGLFSLFFFFCTLLFCFTFSCSRFSLLLFQVCACVCPCVRVCLYCRLSAFFFPPWNISIRTRVALFLLW